MISQVSGKSFRASIQTLIFVKVDMFQTLSGLKKDYLYLIVCPFFVRPKKGPRRGFIRKGAPGNRLYPSELRNFRGFLNSSTFGELRQAVILDPKITRSPGAFRRGFLCRRIVFLPPSESPE